MVGGFAESEYLQEEIGFSLRLRDIELRRPDTSWSAVVQGAVICGIEKSTTKNLITTSKCRQSYGVSVRQEFSDIKHDLKDLIPHEFSRVKMAEGQMLWLLNKGDVILSSEPKVGETTITVAFMKTEPRTGTMTIYMYPDDDRPERIHNAMDGTYRIIVVTEERRALIVNRAHDCYEVAI